MSKPLTCQTCSKETDAWNAFLFTINHPVEFLHDTAARFIGYETATFHIDLMPDAVAEISFSEQGIPAGSRILRLNYTAQGVGLQPVELHSNNVSFRRGRDTVHLYGRLVAVPAGNLPKTAFQLPIKIAVYVAFAEPTVDEHARSALTRAFVALAAGEYVEMVIPAVTAIEFSCKQLIEDFKSFLISQKRIKDKDLLSNTNGPLL